MAQELKRPEFIEGGCLCGAGRWKITFPPGAEYPPESIHCHCTMCRKGPGGLVATFIIVTPPQLTWSSKSTFKEYASSDRARRAFCTTCGGCLGWRDVNDQTKALVPGASVDEEYLNDKELGVLQGGKVSLFCKNIIPGIDDGVKYTTVEYVTMGPELMESKKA